MPMPMPMMIIVPMTVTVAKQKRAHNVYDQTHNRNERSGSELNLRRLLSMAINFDPLLANRIDPLAHR